MWPWKRKPPAPEIPPFKLDFKPPEVKDVGMTVTESDLTETGLWRLFPHKKPKKPEEKL